MLHSHACHSPVQPKLHLWFHSHGSFVYRPHGGLSTLQTCPTCQEAMEEARRELDTLLYDREEKVI